MSSGAGGIPESSGAKPPEKVEGAPDKVNPPNLGEMKFRTLGDLKKMLVQRLGEKKGTQMYNQFISSIASMMMTPTREAAKHAEDAAKKMREQAQQ